MEKGLPQAQGAELISSGVRYRIWAPEHERIDVKLLAENGATRRTVALARDDDGHHHGVDAEGRAGDLYKYEIDGRGIFPDPVSRFQPNGVHGPSMVIDPSVYHWRDAGWRKPSFRDLIFYEIHVGAFMAEGTFAAVAKRLPDLRDLGINAIELMPLADFPGDRNWGYDGVKLFAPARVYGHPDDLRGLVDAAHRAEIAVILDVVYNHFGPDGNYLRSFSSHYFNSDRKTPWGDSLNFDRPDSLPVRSFFISNAIYWMREFHIDGFRLDATHTIYDESPKHILAEIAEAVHAHGGYVIAEDERNESKIITEPAAGGYGYDAVWADDFHHNVQVALTDDPAYRNDYQGDVEELVDTLQHGWIYRGKFNRHFGQAWGTECGTLPLEKFVFCISNHDQVGNRAFGERLHQNVSSAAYRAASALICLAPYTPLLFMGQEWAASTPFLYFTNHHADLGKLVTEGRRKEFQRSKQFRDPEKAKCIPDPQMPETFLRSKLNWPEREDGEHAPTLRLYKRLLQLRREHPAFRPSSRDAFSIAQLESGIAALRFHDEKSDWLTLVDLRGKHRGDLNKETFCELKDGAKWAPILSSNAQEFGGAARLSFDEATNRFVFDEPEVLLLQANFLHGN